MSCEQWFEAVSALADGEEPGVDPRLAEAHLASCPACRAQQARLVDLRRPFRVGPAEPMPDLSGRVAKLVAMADRASRWVLVRVLLGVVAVYLVTVSMWTMLVADAYGSDVHAARHLGAFTLAYGVGLLAVVVRPARARTILPAACILVAALVLTAVVDVVDGRATVPLELRHVPEVLSVVLVWLLAVPALHRPAGTTPVRGEMRLVRTASPEGGAGRLASGAGYRGAGSGRPWSRTVD